VNTLGADSGVVFRQVTGLEPAEICLAWLEGNTSELVVEFLGAARDAFSTETAPSSSIYSFARSQSSCRLPKLLSGARTRGFSDGWLRICP
jgi:hypothetical protein